MDWFGPLTFYATIFIGDYLDVVQVFDDVLEHNQVSTS